jgi:allantoinase
VIVEDERVAAIGAYSDVLPDMQVKDFGSDFVLPGLIDTHIHINEPGRTEWEGFETATRAAAAGGYTCLIDMPLNSVPATTNVEALEEKRAAAKGKALVDYAFWGGAVEGNAANLKALAAAGVAGFKAFLVPSGVDEFKMLSEAGLREAMPVIAASGLPFLVHAELPGPVEDGVRGLAECNWKQYSNYLHSRPDEAEILAIRLMISLVREFRCRVHIVHLATSYALPELQKARAEGLPITVETCPHYLYFAAEGIPEGATQFKCAPPIRAAFHRARLWQALKEGDIDLIATDHSPCPIGLKRLDTGNFQTAWGGIASVSLALAAVWTKARGQEISISQIARWMCEQPAALSGLAGRKGRIAVGADADLTIFDPDRAWQVTEDSLHFRNKISPYLGEHLTGQVKATFVRGELVYDNGRFPAVPAGRECKGNKI